MATPLIETEGGSAVDSGDSAQTSSATTAGAPAVTISFGDGASTTLTADDLQLYIAAIQTLLLLYVAYKEVRR